MSEPLRYQISSLRQLPNCLSNNSKKLHIRTADYIHQTNVTGFKTSIEHEDYGVLFAYLANAKGYIVTESESEELSLADLLSVLAKYGFLIEFDPSKHMDGNQLQYLANLRNFGYDKIRTLSVYPLHRTQPARTHIVAFKSAGKHTSVWISSNYTCSESQFISAEEKAKKSTEFISATIAERFPDISVE